MQTSTADVRDDGPDLFAFQNYRDYLRAHYEHRKSRSRGFSFATLARKGGLGSRSYLSLVMNGRRNLGLRYLPAIARALDLDAKEAQYFAALVNFNQAVDEKSREAAYAELRQILRRRRPEALAGSVGEGFYESWATPFVYYLLQGDPTLDEHAIKARFVKSVSIQDVRAALKVLQKQGLAEWNAAARRWSVKPGSTRSSDEVDAYALRRFHAHVIRLAADALELPVSERELSSLTLNLTPKQFETLKRKLKELRAEIFAEYDGKDATAPLYQVSLQLHPITKTARSLRAESAALEETP